MYFENVGGHVWAAVFPRLNPLRPRPGVRLIAMYNEPGLPPGPDRTPALLAAIVVESLTIRGLIQTEFAADLMGELLERATPWVRDGSLKHKEDIVDGLENAPEAFLGMLDGKNFGKLLVPVS